MPGRQLPLCYIGGQIPFLNPKTLQARRDLFVQICQNELL